jgi:hypothetical protein
MFPRRRIRYSVYGLSFIFMYLTWLLRETSQRFTGNLAPATSPIAATTLATSVVVGSLYSFFTKKEPPKRRAVTRESVQDAISYVNQKNYTREDFATDKKYLTDIVMDIYKNNHIDKCKLDYIFAESPNFKIILANISESLPRTRALYAPDVFSIYLNNYFERSLLDIRKIDTSHELRHAVEALDNFKLKRCLSWDSKYAMAMNHGYFENCGEDKPAFDETMTLMNLDLDRLQILYNDARIAGNNIEVDSILYELKVLVDKYKYKRHRACIRLENESHDSFITKLHHYVFNDTTKSYLATKQFYAVRPVSYHKPGHMLVGFIIEYNPHDDACQLLITHTHPEDKSEFVLMMDVLAAVVTRIRQVFSVRNETDYPSEFSTSLDEVTAPYTHKIDNETVTLREWLAPNMHRHELARASKEYRDCLEHKPSFRP